MRGNRLVLGLTGATLAAAAAYALTIGTLMTQTLGGLPPLGMLAFGGMLWGGAFSMVVLLPLWLLFRRTVAQPWLQLGLPAVTLWATISTAIFATREMSTSEVLGNTLTALPTGIACVAAFIHIMRRPYD